MHKVRVPHVAGIVSMRGRLDRRGLSLGAATGYRVHVGAIGTHLAQFRGTRLLRHVKITGDPGAGGIGSQRRAGVAR